MTRSSSAGSVKESERGTRPVQSHGPSRRTWTAAAVLVLGLALRGTSSAPAQVVVSSDGNSLFLTRLGEGTQQVDVGGGVLEVAANAFHAYALANGGAEVVRARLEAGSSDQTGAVRRERDGRQGGDDPHLGATGSGARQEIARQGGESVSRRAVRRQVSAGAGPRRGKNPGRIGMAGEWVPIRVARVRSIDRVEIPLRLYDALNGRHQVNERLLERVPYGISSRNDEAAVESGYRHVPKLRAAWKRELKIDAKGAMRKAA